MLMVNATVLFMVHINYQRWAQNSWHLYQHKRKEDLKIETGFAQSSFPEILCFPLHPSPVHRPRLSWELRKWSDQSHAGNNSEVIEVTQGGQQQTMYRNQYNAKVRYPESNPSGLRRFIGMASSKKSSIAKTSERLRCKMVESLLDASIQK